MWGEIKRRADDESKDFCSEQLKKWFHHFLKWESPFPHVKGEDQEFSCRHTTFKMPTRYPRGMPVKQGEI